VTLVQRGPDAVVRRQCAIRTTIAD
jgi:hypothetical protein